MVGAPEFQVTLLRTLRLANDELLLVWREESLEAARLLAATVNVSQPPLHALESPRLLATGTMVGPPTMLADGAGALIGWSERGAGNESVRLVRLIAGAAVAPGWPANGAALCAGPVGFDAPAILADGDGGATVAWVDRRLDDDGDIFAQRVAAAGSRHASWPEQGFAVCVASGEQFAPALAPDGNGGAIVTWVDTANQPAGGSLLLAGQSVIRPQLIETSIDPGRVRFTWSVDRKTPATYRAYRIEEGGELRELATLIPDGRGQIAMEDAQAPEGREVGYSLSVSIGEEERFLTPIRVQVPVTPLELALQRAWSPPGSDVIRIEFALPRGPAPRLELIDVAGRRVASRTLAEYLPGQRSAEIRPASGTRTGVYFVRLTQGSRTLSRKVVLVR
ncbi:MAG: T9SS type A sorting domain-containing protein [Candidatus Eisenbacteria bacterium]|uniref:T9SS type A sorting domain-containing protein n=1 Tax=Eiseniibacteriota bacterium TaxID=2212470 RepID=A0A849SRI0_UNCEI|nr:T9SS type A sorting domain-containing protein [Candidatus Eisenbacteria bacterium]